MGRASDQRTAAARLEGRAQEWRDAAVRLRRHRNLSANAVQNVWLEVARAAVERQELKRPPVADEPPLGVPRMVVAKAPAGGGVSPLNVALMSS